MPWRPGDFGRGQRQTVTLRQTIHGALALQGQGPAALRLRAVAIALILGGIISVALGTVEEIGAMTRAAAAWVTGIVAMAFLIEYLLRLWSAPEAPSGTLLSPAQARWRWALSVEGLIDLAAIVPALAVASGGARLGADSASIFVLLWVLKLASHAPGVELVARVVRNERAALGAVMILFVIVLLSAATLAHFAEEPVQPQEFGSIPAALWWAIVTLTTTGYGDVVPKTGLGRLIGGVLMVCGIAVLALLAGILATGFAEEVKRREFVRIWELVARVPFFGDAGAIAISDIVARLRSRLYPAGAAVVRKGAPGDSMFFIVSGEVEVRTGAGPVVLRDGSFFGELALLDRKPRTADVVTLTPCTLLVLNVADFYHIAGQQPSLLAGIEAEAKRRRAANADPPGRRPD